MVGREGRGKDGEREEWWEGKGFGIVWKEGRKEDGGMGREESKEDDGEGRKEESIYLLAGREGKEARKMGGRREGTKTMGRGRQ